MSVYPQVATSATKIRITVYLFPLASDRILVVVADSENFRRESGLELAGEHTPKQHVFEWYALPEGEYDIIAAVGNGRSWRARAHTTLIVS